MTNAQSDAQGNTTWWITSLAISVVCCAILFVVFAGYLFGFREKLLVVETKLSMMEQRNAQLNMEIDNLSRRAHVQQIQIIPPGVAASSAQNPQPNSQPASVQDAGGGQNAAPPIVGILPKQLPRANTSVQQAEPPASGPAQAYPQAQVPVSTPANAQGGVATEAPSAK